jgi:hypothetical protein
MPTRLTETTPLSEAGSGTSKSGKMKVSAISAGMGSSGYYSPEVIEQAGRDQLITAGTHLYLDHPTDAEALERPVRSVKDIAAVFTESATYDPVTESLVGEIQVMAPYRGLLEDLAPHIGLSIRGDGELVEGEYEGCRVNIVESLHSIQSVDFVTRAGRGGKVLSLVESARANERAIGHGLAESTVNDTREALQQVLRDAYGTGEGVWIYVRDFDDSTVWFEIEGAGDDTGIYGQSYDANDGAVSLSGERTEVRVVTNYVPATRPGSNTPTEESKENPMGNISIEEAEHRRLTEAAGRVTALEERATTAEAERDEAVTERDQLREEKAVSARSSRAVAIVEARATEAGVGYTALEVKGLCVDLPLKEDGTLDEAAFTTSIDEDAAARKAAGGSGLVIGHGGQPGGGSAVTLADLDEAQGLSKEN